MENKENLGAFKASFLIIKESFGILKQEKEILFFPIAAFFTHLALITVFLSAIFFLLLGGSLDTKVENVNGGNIIASSIFFTYYIVSLFITNFYQTGVFSIAHARFSGGDISFGDGIKVAWSKFGVLILWSLVMATVGVIISFIERQRTLGWIVGKILGVAWAVLTYFSLPLLVIGNKNIKESFEESAFIMKKTWGETAFVYFGTGYATFLIALFIFLLPFLSLFAADSVFYPVLFVLIGIALFLLICLVVITSALNAIFKLALYEYASTGLVPQGFSEELITKGVRSKE